MKAIVAQKPACRHCGATLKRSFDRCPKCGRRSFMGLLLPRWLRI